MTYLVRCGDDVHTHNLLRQDRFRVDAVEASSEFSILGEGLNKVNKIKLKKLLEKIFLTTSAFYDINELVLFIVEAQFNVELSNILEFHLFCFFLFVVKTNTGPVGKKSVFQLTISVSRILLKNTESVREQ